MRLFIDALWSPAGKGLTSCFSFLMSNCVFVTFPCGILGQVWYLIVLIPDLCPFLLFLVDHTFYIICSFYRLSLPCTTAIVFSAYVSTEDDILNIKATTCNCFVVAHLTKLAISIFLGKMIFNQRFYSQFFQENFTILLFFVRFDKIFTEWLVLHNLLRYSH